MKRSAAHSLFSTIFLLLPTAFLVAQTLSNKDFDFLNQTFVISANKFQSDVVIAVSDLNGDNLDDLIRLKKGRELEIQYQQADGSFVKVKGGEISDKIQASICVADLDGDQINDFMTGGFYDGLKVFRYQNGTYAPQQLPTSEFEVQGANFADIDADGDLDAFVCNDKGTSYIWRNDGGGVFEKDNTLINFDLHPARNGGNYSSMWTDFDDDGDLDLYLSKCFPNATASDPQRINQLFVNDGNNNYTEQGLAHGLASSEQSWTADFQDIDNDGDLDCFVVNHYSPSQLFENLGNGNFKDITPSSLLNVQNNHLQGILRDFDSDGWVDILLAGNDGHEIFHNLKDKTFSRSTQLFEDYLMSSYAVGDLNHDGYLDIYSSSSDDFYSDVLWTNHLTANSFLAINLEGTLSNYNAVGARVELYGPWGVQVREVRSGEGYGIQNTFVQYFGMDKIDKADSLVIRWPQPSNRVDVFLDVKANQFLQIIEGEIPCSDGVITTIGSTNLFNNTEVTLTAPIGVNYLWSTGENTRSIKVRRLGMYSVLVENQFGCAVQSNEVEVYYNTNVSNSELSDMGVKVFPTLSDGHLNIDFSSFNNFKEVAYTIVNLQGQHLTNGNINPLRQSTHRLDLNHLPVGTYFLGLHLGEGQWHYQKFILYQ